MPPVATFRCTSLKRIVFGTDFSPVAERAATCARGLALSFSAKVDVVHVFDTDLFLDDDEPRLRSDWRRAPSDWRRWERRSPAWGSGRRRSWPLLNLHGPVC